MHTISTLSNRIPSRRSHKPGTLGDWLDEETSTGLDMATADSNASDTFNYTDPAQTAWNIGGGSGSSTLVSSDTSNLFSSLFSTVTNALGITKSNTIPITTGTVLPRTTGMSTKTMLLIGAVGLGVLLLSRRH
jgi:hypothetical protein